MQNKSIVNNYTKQNTENNKQLLGQTNLVYHIKSIFLHHFNHEI